MHLVLRTHPPPFAEIDIKAEEASYIIRIHDRPLQIKLNYYEERQR